MKDNLVTVDYYYKGIFERFYTLGIVIGNGKMRKTNFTIVTLLDSSIYMG